MQPAQNGFPALLIMRILHVITQRPDSTGSGTYVQAMIREANAAGHKSFLLAGVESSLPIPAVGLPHDQCLLVKFDGPDISFPIVGMSDVMPYPSRTFRSLSPEEIAQYEAVFSHSLRVAFENARPDVIHAHHLWIVTSLARQLFPDTPVVASCHGSDLRQFEYCVHLRERVLRGCRALDVVLALTEAQRTDIVSLYKIPDKRVRSVGAGYDQRIFVQAAKPAPNPVQLIYAGKLSRSKGVPHLLRALRQIDSLPWRLHVVGSGAGEEIRLDAASLGALRERVCIHGARTQVELAALMKQSHVLVMPSLYEGFGLVLLEAIASGCRIVTTRLPGVQEVLGGEALSFVEVVSLPRLHSVDRPYAEDEPAFESALATALRVQIEAAIRHPDIELGAFRARLDDYSWARVFARVQQAYKR